MFIQKTRKLRNYNDSSSDASEEKLLLKWFLYNKIIVLEDNKP